MNLVRALHLMVECVIGASLLVACGAGKPSESPEPDHAEDGQVQAMLDSQEFQAAMDRYDQCMHDAGYVETDSAIGVILKDGTVHKPGVGEKFEITGAYLEYRLDSDRCTIASGVNEVRETFGTADPTPNPNLIRARNQNTTRQMACLAGKGWAIPEPQMLKGALVWDITFETEEQRVSFSGDQIACNLELFGTVGLPY